jgi:hypothetical protein
MNQNQKNTGKGYSEAIQDKEEKPVATMKWIEMHFYIVCVSLVLSPSLSFPSCNWLLYFVANVANVMKAAAF